MGLKYGALFGLMLVVWGAPAQADERPSLDAMWTESAIQIDGVLDEEAWKQAPIAGGFVERKPTLRAVPEDATTLRVLFDKEALYIAVRCEDSQAETISANVRTRDTTAMFADDVVSVKLDIKSDKRTTLGFAINPANARLEYLGINEGGFRLEFDVIWQGATSQDASGWSAEFRLPWSSLDVDPAEAPARVGLNISRDHPRRNATYDWSLMPPPFTPVSASLYGDLLGLDELSRRLEASGEGPGVLKDWYVTAYGLGGFRHEPSDGASEATVYEPVYNGGLDARVDFGPAQIDLTLNTDFAQVDLDNRIVNLGRFGLFLPEKRDFFLSNMALFQFGFGGSYQLLHTRRIGLHNGEEVPIVEGLKVTARPTEALQMSLLHVTSLATSDLPDTSHGVFRAQYELGGGSNLGLMMTHRQSMSDLNDHNLVIGVDGAWRGSGTPMLAEGFAAVSLDDDGQAEEPGLIGGMAGAKLRWRGELVRPELTYLYVHPDFQADLGFIRRTAIQSFDGGLLVEPRPGVMGLEKIRIMVGGKVVTDETFESLLDWGTGAGVGIYGASGYGAELEVNFNSELINDAFEVGPKTIQPGRYEALMTSLSFWTPHNAPLKVSPYVALGDYFNGTIATAGLSATLRPIQALRFMGDARYDHATFDDGGDFDSLVINGAMNADFLPDLGIKVQVGWSQLENRLQFQSRLRWSYLPGSDLFLVYQADLDGDATTLAFQSLQLKVTFRYPWH
ncbi:MAG: carbohydrate binding family 9 domain-containing protein [Myxococcota bacterium]